MNPVEIFLICLIAFPALWVIYRAWHSDPAEIFSPRVFFSVLMLYYTVVGPLVTIAQTNVDILGVFVRPVLWKGWLASAVAYAFFLIGYMRPYKRYDPVKVRARDDAVFIVSLLFFIFASYGMIYWIVQYGGGISFLNPTYTGESAEMALLGFERAGAVYLGQLINLSFGAAALLLLFVLERRSKLTVVLFCFLVIFCILFFVKTGFRYRIAWLGVSLTSTYFLWRGKRPKFLFWVPVGIVFIAAMGLIGATRTYFGGLSLNKVAGANTSDVFMNGFSEAGTFYFLSQAVDAVPREYPHTTWDPFWIAITYPIPRSLWPNKPNSATMETLAAAFGGKEAYSAGMAVSYYGEWYIAFGWVGIIVSSLVFGLLARNLWEWYQGHLRDKLALVIYSVGLGFVYVAFSRGLLAQAFLNFSFSLLPLMLIYKFLPKYIIRMAPANRGPHQLAIEQNGGLGPLNRDRLKK